MKTILQKCFPAFFLLCIMLVSMNSWGQTIIFTETIGTCCSSTTTTIALTTFDNSGLTYSGTADTRTSTASTDYTGSSGSRNVFITNTIERFFMISGINTIGFTDLMLSFGHQKSTIAGNNELVVEVSEDGSNWSQLTYSRPTGTGTTNWLLITPTGIIPATANLSIRFRQTSISPQFRIDDIKLVGTPTTTQTTWNGTTWSNGAPTNTVDAIIDGDLTTSSNVICKDLTVNSGRILTISGANKLSVIGNLMNNGSIVFKSNNTSTGRFDTYTGASITGSGSITMERFIDGKRAFRLLAPGVSTSGFIADNWQQQIFITGLTTGSNGFDATTTGAASMFTFGDNGWGSIANTNALQLNANQGYRVLIRGDRTTSLLTSPSNGNMNTPVTLSATGTMVTGDVIYNTLPNQEYTLIANPYISPINWVTITKSGVTDTYYAWDPNLGTGVQRGRFVSCDVAGITSVISDNGSPNTDIDQHIQPGQAVFIKKATIGTPGSITVKESDKASTFTDVFRTSEHYTTQNTIQGKLGINLYESLAYSLGDYPIDGAVALSGNTFNTESANDDTKKIMSHGEQVTFVRENIQLGIEKISTPVMDDVLTIGSVNLVPNKSYVWNIILQDDFSNLDTYLYDVFTQNYHLLTNSNTTAIPFETTNDINSTFVNRFKIVFQETMHVDDFSLNVTLYPNPGKSNQSFYLSGVTEAKVSMQSLLGQEIPVTTRQNGQTIEVKPETVLSTGVYFVRITQAGKTAQVKWIVE